MKTTFMSDEDDLVEWEDLEEWEDRESFEDRIRRGPLLGALLWTAIVAGAAWVVLNAVIQIRTARGYADIFSSEGPAELWVWMQAANGIAYTVFLVALGSYILLWLRFRQRSDANE
jgi:hypothetical protein